MSVPPHSWLDEFDFWFGYVGGILTTLISLKISQWVEKKWPQK
jgi:hypothetical protein